MLEILGSRYSDPENVCFPAFARVGEERIEQVPVRQRDECRRAALAEQRVVRHQSGIRGQSGVHHRPLGLGAEATVRLRARGETATTGGAA